MVFSKALQNIPAESKKRIEKTIGEWENVGESLQCILAENLQSECLLPEKNFDELLRKFSQNLLEQDATQAFEEACYHCKLKGPSMGGVFPIVIGRAAPLNRFCGWIIDKNPDLDKKTVERLVRSHAVSDRTSVANKIAKAPVGRYVIWSTFKNPNRNEIPFQSPLSTKEAVKTALGLGGVLTTEPWILLVYLPQCEQQELRLPTVADAGKNPYFQPVPKTQAQPEHGWTKPLSPNPDELAPQPEIVHNQDISYQIRLPLIIWE